MEVKNQINNLKYLKETRQTLRNNATKAEQFLWNFLKGKQLKNTKFRRQHSVGNFIIDFYCAEKRIAIEIDGSIHERKDVKMNDKEKTETLNFYNIKVLRFTNEDVFDNIVQVLDTIEQNI
jgi:very-short-patch-repair endonuclease